MKFAEFIEYVEPKLNSKGVFYHNSLSDQMARYKSRTPAKHWKYTNRKKKPTLE